LIHVPLLRSRAAVVTKVRLGDDSVVDPSEIQLHQRAAIDAMTELVAITKGGVNLETSYRQLAHYRRRPELQEDRVAVPLPVRSYGELCSKLIKGSELSKIMFEVGVGLEHAHVGRRKEKLDQRFLVSFSCKKVEVCHRCAVTHGL